MSKNKYLYNKLCEMEFKEDLILLNSHNLTNKEKEEFMRYLIKKYWIKNKCMVRMVLKMCEISKCPNCNQMSEFDEIKDIDCEGCCGYHYIMKCKKCGKEILDYELD